MAHYSLFPGPSPLWPTACAPTAAHDKPFPEWSMGRLGSARCTDYCAVCTAATWSGATMLSLVTERLAGGGCTIRTPGCKSVDEHDMGDIRVVHRGTTARSSTVRVRSTVNRLVDRSPITVDGHWTVLCTPCNHSPYYDYNLSITDCTVPTVYGYNY
jgi:hypothetical protein